MPAKIRNLLDRGGRYYARLVVPIALRPFIGKRELLEPLGADRKEALRKLPGTVGRMQDQLNAARQESKPIQRTVRVHSGRAMSDRQMAVAHYENEIALDRASRQPLPAHTPDPDETPLNPSFYEYKSELFRPHYESVLKKVASGRFSDDEADAAVGWILDDFAAQGVPVPERGSKEWRERLRVLAGVQLEAMKRTAERDQGDFNGKPSHSALVPPAPTPGDPLLARCINPDSMQTLKEIVPQYLNERGAKPQTNYETNVTVRMLNECLGEEKPVYRITRADVRTFKTTLLEAPASYTKRFSGMTLPEAIKANNKRAKPFERLNVRTINDKYLSKLHSLLNWCVRNDLIPDNPASKQKIEAVKATAPPRINFSPSDLTRIFGEHFDKRPTEDQWAMLISLFTGMRASELGQVKLDSIRHERGVLVFAIEEETKNIGSQRLTPVHSKLIELGLDKRIKELRKAGETHLFPQWHKDAETSQRQQEAKGDGQQRNSGYPVFIPRRFNDTYKAKVGIVDARKVWHSFRHTFKTGLARAGVNRQIQDDLCGHEDYSAGGRYIHETSVEAMKEAIEKLNFDGFPL